MSLDYLRIPLAFYSFVDVVVETNNFKQKMSLSRITILVYFVIDVFL